MRLGVCLTGFFVAYEDPIAAARNNPPAWNSRQDRPKATSVRSATTTLLTVPTPVHRGLSRYRPLLIVIALDRGNGPLSYPVCVPVSRSTPAALLLAVFVSLFNLLEGPRLRLCTSCFSLPPLPRPIFSPVAPPLPRLVNASSSHHVLRLRSRRRLQVGINLFQWYGGVLVGALR